MSPLGAGQSRSDASGVVSVLGGCNSHGAGGAGGTSAAEGCGQWEQCLLGTKMLTMFIFGGQREMQPLLCFPAAGEVRGREIGAGDSRADRMLKGSGTGRNTIIGIPA